MARREAGGGWDVLGRTAPRRGELLALGDATLRRSCRPVRSRSRTRVQELFAHLTEYPDPVTGGDLGPRTSSASCRGRSLAVVLVYHCQFLGLQRKQTPGQVVPLWFHGGSIVVPWWFHDVSMVVPWWFHSGSIVASWWFHGGSMMVPWWFHQDKAKKACVWLYFKIHLSLIISIEIFDDRSIGGIGSGETFSLI